MNIPEKVIRFFGGTPQPDPKKFESPIPIDMRLNVNVYQHPNGTIVLSLGRPLERLNFELLGKTTAHVSMVVDGGYNPNRAFPRGNWAGEVV